MKVPGFFVWAFFFVLFACGIAFGFADNYLACSYPGTSVFVFPYGLVLAIGCIASEVALVIWGLAQNV